MNPRVSIIVAIDEKRGIGKNNDLLVKIPEDFKRMKELTSGHPIILGRRTYESIGRLLPNRTSIIVTRDSSFAVDGAVVANSLEDSLEKAKSASGAEEVFIFGGGQIFKEALEKGLVDRLYLTIIKGDYGADTFFPDYEICGFTKIIEKVERDADGYQYSFVTLEK
jgi:dihydrofolate reductase|nr:Dihydrofolate reductase [uncultured bacterium]AIA14726.1 Dihydrofolate reductase [uncultured bacterium]